MSTVDPVRISKTMSFLLRHRPDVGRLRPDEHGWVDAESLAAAVSRLLKQPVDADDLRRVISGADTPRFEESGGRIRARPRLPGRGQRDRKGRSHPDILYHATTAARVEKVVARGVLAGGPRHVFLSASEAHAWRVAHRLEGEPAVLVIDTSRARRHGVRFWRNRRNGLFMATPIPVSDILSLQEHFARQLSAGGIPVRFDAEGRPEVALIKVTRRSGITWEVAKGKLEPGEPPEHTALREVREEMGVDVPMRVTRYVDTVRYGFLTPGGEPRLKSVFVYLMEPQGPMEEFVPMTREGIGEVRWFSIAEACRAVTHSSLIPVMRQVRRILEQGPTYAAEPRTNGESGHGSHP